MQRGLGQARMGRWDRGRVALLVLAGVVWLALAGTAAGQAGEGPGQAQPEGTRPVVSIAVEGNQRVSDDVVLKALKHTQVGQPFSEEGARKDLEAIYETGYFTRSGLRAQFREVEGGVEVIFHVQENPVVADVEVKGVKQVTPAQVKALLGTGPGEVLNPKLLQEQVQALPQKIFDTYGVAVQPKDLAFDPARRVVTLTLVETRVAAVRVEGNYKTRDSVILREIRIKPGDIVRREAIRESVNRLLRLGYFNTVKPRFERAEDPEKTVLVFEVEEAKTGSASFGAGYNTDKGFIGFVEVADRNFFGRGQRVNLRFSFGQSITTYDAGFYEPYVTPSGLSFGFDVYHRRDTFNDLLISQPDIRGVETRTGGDVTIGHPLGDYTRGSLTFRMDHVTRDPTDPISGPVPPEELENDVRSVTFATRTDTTNHFLSPTAGFRSRLSVETAGGFLGGSVDFTKYRGEFSTYLKVGRADQVVALRAIGGYGTGETATADPFRVGGGETLRGYDYSAFKGDEMLVLNGEYRFPLTDIVQGVVFLDAGKAWEREEGGVDLSDLRLGYGAGLRLNTVLGMIRVDYGFGEVGSQIYFSLGPSF